MYAIFCHTLFFSVEPFLPQRSPEKVRCCDLWCCVRYIVPATRCVLHGVLLLRSRIFPLAKQLRKEKTACNGSLLFGLVCLWRKRRGLCAPSAANVVLCCGCSFNAASSCAGVHLRLRGGDDQHNGQVQDGRHRRLQEDQGPPPVTVSTACHVKHTLPPPRLYVPRV